MKRNARGFTLTELIVTVTVLGVLTAVVAPLIGNYLSARESAYRERATLDNQRIATALLDFAATQTPRATLPLPYSGAGYTKTVFNPADNSVAGLALQQGLYGTGVSPAAINDDGYQSKRVRVYQLVPGIQHQVPLYYRSGPLVTLSYDYGVLYQTACQKLDASCNPRAVTGVPGDSPELKATNLTTWDVAGEDYPATHLSTLPLQMAMLSATAQRLDRIRDKLISHLRDHQVTANAGDETNWFPGTGSGGKDPLLTQGCRDGWYSLVTSNVLPTLGVAPEEYGVTAWGGAIEYCRDYDADASGLPNKPPHYAALRVNRSLSLGVVPDPALPAANIVLTF